MSIRFKNTYNFNQHTNNNLKTDICQNWFRCICVCLALRDYNFDVNIKKKSHFTYNDLRLCKPKNILLWISVILFSDMSKSCIFNAPSNAFGSIPVIWLRRKSNFTKFGKRPNNPSDLMRPNSLSLSNLRKKEKNACMYEIVNSGEQIVRSFVCID